MKITPGWPVGVALIVMLVVTVVAGRLGGINLGRQSVVSGLRAVLQLGFAALVITAVVGSLGLSLLAIALMFAIAVGTTTKRIGASNAWPYAALAMVCGIAPVLAVLLITGTIPFVGIALIPTAGIILGNTMTVHTLVGRRAYAALREEHGQYEAALSIGLVAAQAIDEIISRRVPEGILPSLDQVRTAGVVTLPGAFIGVMLGGGSAIQAATAQVMVLFSIMATQAITASIEAAFIRRRLLLPDDLRVALIS